MYLYINGQIVNKDEARISPFDHGYLYGMGLFETFRVYKRHPFLLDDHLERLNAGLEVLNIKKQFHREKTNKVLQQLLEANKLTNAYIRFNVSAGIGEVGLQVAPYMEPNIVIFAKSLPATKEMTEKKAVILKLKRNTPEGLDRLKSHHYMNNMLAKREIGDATGLEGIFLTEEGFIAEGIVSNIFWKQGNTLYTPALSTGILNGITRQFIIQLAKRNRMRIVEGFYRYQDAASAEEMFVTNSIQEIVPISQFEDLQMPGKNGLFVQQLHTYYRESCELLWSRSGII
ncbi:aminodeoxychorismate lyase [Neobacillus ginsengisoli]|uniref:4-amino-4-deoxychorismate lyase n=1 Tax=Neobacillus ginsengisoli TaxID=904295 RepID=A0ABT9XX57_9BACI|nr:aminodeoxychorismate lyase [Neobacillus ginsengisoli]MDQ0200155.1 4-amino-4-deoxychorismate lyase [Neobacillus ginsengisoli]